MVVVLFSPLPPPTLFAQAGKAAIEELLKQGATAEKRDANGRTALELLKSLPLSSLDTASGKEIIVRQIAVKATCNPAPCTVMRHAPS